MLQTPATLQMIQDIKQGLIPVGKAVEADNATSAENDGNGDNIANTYAKQNGSYPGMSVGTAVSAADATHATDADNDGDGNNIASTYAKKGGRLIPLLYTSTGQCIALLPSGTYPDVLDMGFINGVASGATLPSGWNMGDFVTITAVNDLNVTVVNQHNGNIFGYTATGKYDVGDYYISNSSTSPAAKYGGSWTQLQGRFILASGDGYTLGSTGGSANTTISVNNLPAHSHIEQMCFEEYSTDNGVRNLGYRNGSSDGPNKYWNTAMPHGGSTAALSTQETGGGQSLSTIPQYRVANIWYRYA